MLDAQFYDLIQSLWGTFAGAMAAVRLAEPTLQMAQTWPSCASRGFCNYQAGAHGGIGHWPHDHQLPGKPPGLVPHPGR